VWIDDLVDPARTLAAFADGATIVLNSLHRWWPPLGSLCHGLEGELGHPVQANAYLTPAGAAGFAPHHDTHDVLVLQVEGSKHWTVRAPLVEAPLERHRSDQAASAEQPVLFDGVLQPGDCLYLPRGFVHSAAAQDETSLHLTIGVLVHTRHDLLRRIVDRTAEEPAFRQSLPVRYATDPDTARRVVKDAVAELMTWLESLPVEEVADDLVWREGHLHELATSRPVTDATVVALRPGMAWRVRPATGSSSNGSPPRVVLELPDRRIEVPATVAPALERLLTAAPTPVAGLDDLLDERSRVVLVRRLLREAVLRRVDAT
jgi:lysine-specific demethylase/histidyl-hydroxylase NO66